MQLPQETIRQILAERNPKTPDDIMNALREMFREVLEEALVVEMEEHLGYEKSDMAGRQEIGAQNSRNGSNRKTIKTELGPIEVSIPRDRNGEFEPEILPNGFYPFMLRIWDLTTSAHMKIMRIEAYSP